MKKGTYLIKNMAFFTLGSFISKLLTFFLVPFYTSVLSEGEFGTADVMQASLLLLVPLLSLNAGEAALRFGLENTDDRDSILYFGLRRALISVIPAALIALLLIPVFPESRPFLLLFIPLFAADAVYEFLLLYCQGIEEVQKMITGSISYTVFLIASNMILLLKVKAGVFGYIFSLIIAFLLSSTVMLILLDAPERLRNAVKKSPVGAEMREYGRNMLLYSTASWVNNAIDRYYILFLLGTSDNGLYGAAYKIPAVLTVFQRIFAMAWQMSAVKEYKGEESEVYFSNMYRIYQTALVTGCGALILFLKPIAAFMFRNDFYASWVLVPPLLISVCFGAMEGFLGSIALAFKDGKSMGYATGTGAVFNMILNFILIKQFGVSGAAYATLISYFIMFIMAYFFVKKHVALKVPLLRDMVSYLLLIGEAAVVISGMRNYTVWNAVIFILLILLYSREILDTLNKLTERYVKREDR